MDMTETRAEPFTPAERAVMAARAEAAEWRARAERAEARVADKHAAWMTANAEANDYYTALRAMEARVVAFAGQLQAWDLNDAADELLKEIIGGTVKAPDYYALKAQLAETSARLADLARQATAAGPVLEAAIRLDDADSECIAHHVMYPNDEDGEIELMVEYRAARQALTAAVAALRAAREGK